MGGRNSKRAQIQVVAQSVEPQQASSRESYHRIAEPVDAPKQVNFEEVPLDSNLIPSWVNETNFEAVLQEYVPGFVRILDFKVGRGTNVGENYASLMLRINIEMEVTEEGHRHISFMMKVAHDSEQMRQMLALRNFFASENSVYFDVIAELEQMYREAGQEVCIAPKAYRFGKDANLNTVLLEDLRPRGFKNMNRRDCLDMQHTQAVLKKLAQFHAASACRIALKGPYSDMIMDGFMDANAEQHLQLFGAMFNMGVGEMVKHLPLYGAEQYRSELLDYLDKLMVEMWHEGRYDPDEFNVLCHGDCWSNNVLFKHSPDGSIDETVFVDFQMPRFHSPVMDLHYFLMSSVQLDIKLSQYDYLIRFYYDHLAANLRLLQYPKPIPSHRQLLRHFPKYSSMALMSCTFTLPIILLEDTDNASMENIMLPNEEGAKFRQSLYTSGRYVEYISAILPWLHNRGYLEPYDNALSSLPFSMSTSPMDSSPAIVGPAWLTEEALSHILAENISDFRHLKRLTTSTGTKPGDNFASAMFRLDTDLELADNRSEHVTFMLKVPPPGEHANEMLSSMNVTKKEMTMYQDILPQLTSLLTEAGVNAVFAPHFYRLPPAICKDAILLRHLSDFNFRMISRDVCLDEAHTKAALVKLAAFHAASAQLLSTNNGALALFTPSVPTEQDKEHITKTMDGFLGGLISCRTKLEGNAQYGSKIIELRANIFEVLQQLSQQPADAFIVLNHGDCWLTNMLFQYSESGEILDTRFVDFQLCRVGTPAQDLFNLLLSSVMFDIKLAKFDYFVGFYHEELIRHLQQLKYAKPMPSLRELQAELIRSGFWGVLSVTGPLSAICLETTENASLESMLSDGEAGNALHLAAFGNPKFTVEGGQTLMWLDNRGALDTDIAQLQLNKSIDIPPWIEESYFTGVMAQVQPEFAKIQSMHAELATHSGENYSSRLFKVDVATELRDGSSTICSFILKVPTQVELIELDMWNIFPKELAMYKECLPAFEAFYQAKGKEVKFGPRYFQFQKDPGSEAILMENLHARGFSNAERRKGLDMVHSKAALRKLALFHAASLKYKEERGPFQDLFNKSLFSEDGRKTLESMPKTFIDNILETVATIPGSEVYIDKLRKFFDNYIDRLIATVKCHPEQLNVLNHGDMWTNNIMFQHNADGDITNTCLIDYQLSFYGSPAVDLWYFIVSSPELRLKVQQFENLVTFYHKNLVDNIKLLQCSAAAPSLQELMDILEQHSDLGVMAMTGILAVCLLDKTANATMDNFVASTSSAKEFRKNLYGNPEYKKHLAELMSWFNGKGYLDKEYN